MVYVVVVCGGVLWCVMLGWVVSCDGVLCWTIVCVAYAVTGGVCGCMVVCDVLLCCAMLC